jgi:hypothetical protein
MQTLKCAYESKLNQNAYELQMSVKVNCMVIPIVPKCKNGHQPFTVLPFPGTCLEYEWLKDLMWLTYSASVVMQVDLGEDSAADRLGNLHRQPPSICQPHEIPKSQTGLAEFTPNTRKPQGGTFHAAWPL